MQIEREGARIFFTVAGEGPELVLLHPTPTRQEFWAPVVERLREKYRLISIDLRGHGESTLGTGPVTMERLAGDVRAVLAELKVERAVFAGCSIGAYLLYEYWRRFPGQMRALALVCGKPQPDSAANREKRQQWMELAQRPAGLGIFFDEMADSLVGPTARREHPEVREAARRMMDAVSLDAMLAVQQGLGARPDSVSTLETITVPVCAIAGEEDGSSTPAEMRVVAERVPGAEFHLVEKAGHYAPLERPERVAGILEEFLDKHRAAIWQ